MNRRPMIVAAAADRRCRNHLSSGTSRRPHGALLSHHFRDVRANEPMLAVGRNVSGLAHATPHALTPVFLLTGIAGILNVMTARLPV